MKKQIFILYGKQDTGKSTLLRLLDESKTDIIDDNILAYNPEIKVDTGKEIVKEINKCKKQFIVVSVYKGSGHLIKSDIIFDELKLITDRLNKDKYLVTICNMERSE